jgi:hypothetical protein
MVISDGSLIVQMQGLLTTNFVGTHVPEPPSNRSQKNCTGQHWHIKRKKK